MKKCLFLMISCCFMFGCANTISQLRVLSLGMTKENVVEKMGEPKSTRASSRYSNGVEVWDYVLRRGGFPPKGRQRYWLFFQNNKLVQWGEENDWGKFERDPDYIEKRIYEDVTEKKDEPRFQ